MEAGVEAAMRPCAQDQGAASPPCSGTDHGERRCFLSPVPAAEEVPEEGMVAEDSLAVAPALIQGMGEGVSRKEEGMVAVTFSVKFGNGKVLLRLFLAARASNGKVALAVSGVVVAEEDSTVVAAAEARQVCRRRWRWQLLRRRVLQIRRDIARREAYTWRSYARSSPRPLVSVSGISSAMV